MIISIAKIALPAILLLALQGHETNAQRKPSRKKPAPPVRIIPPLDVRAGREKVEVQLENVSRFIDAYGPKADALELLDGAYAKKKVSEARIAKHAENKKNVIQTIRNLRLGLAALESEFRTKAALQKYLPQIDGIADLVTEAEDDAAGNRFVAAKEPLQAVSKKLATALTFIPR